MVILHKLVTIDPSQYCLFLKVFERVMYVRLFSFTRKYDLLYKYQFGFRQGFGTDTALVFLIDKILKALDEGEIVLGVFIALSKAFDTVNHTILLDKLYKYGIRGMAHVWITNYLYDRKQYVSFNKLDSPYEKVNCGVPQGSILGPLLFLMYINGCQSFRHIAISTQCHFDTEESLRHRNTPKSESFRHSFGRFDTPSHKCILCVYLWGFITWTLS